MHEPPGGRPAIDVGPKWWRVLKSTVLVANRGEIAVRLIDAVRAAGMTGAVISVSVDDAHIRHAHHAVLKAS